MIKKKEVKEIKEVNEVKEVKEVKEEYIVPIDHSYYMCIISSLSFISGVYAIKQQLYAISASPLIVFSTSINYWRKPTYGLRRNIDIFCVISSLSLHMYLSLQQKDTCNINTNYRYCYLAPISVLLYTTSWILHKNHYFWGSTITHSMIHVVANICNVILYNKLS